MKFGSNAHLVLTLFSLGLVAALHAGHAHPDLVIEGAAWYQPKVPTDTVASVSPLGEPVSDRIDVRGVGDTAWARGATPSTGLSTPPAAQFDRAIDRIDPSGALLHGDLNFTNWESVVGERCDSIRRSVDFYFLTHPAAIRQAVEKGFNLFSLANNHAQDCNRGVSTVGAPAVSGPLMTSKNFESLAREISVPFAWAGVASTTDEDAYRVHVVPFLIQGRTVRVAFAAVVSLSWDIPSAATLKLSGGPATDAKVDRLLADFQKADADFRILSIHTQDSSGEGRPEGPAFRMLKRVAERFVLEASGDVVFGEGPHTWGGVKVLTRADGKQGVIFTSLGNFIHDGLRDDRDNYIARALWDRDTLRLREVQVTPFRNARTTLSTYSSAATTKPPLANFHWDPMTSKMNGGSVVGYSARFR